MLNNRFLIFWCICNAIQADASSGSYPSSSGDDSNHATSGDGWNIPPGGNDWSNWSDGDDSIYPTDGGDSIYPTDGGDSIYPTDDDDSIYPTDDDDSIRPTDGDDSIHPTDPTDGDSSQSEKEPDEGEPDEDVPPFTFVKGRWECSAGDKANIYKGTPPTIDMCATACTDVRDGTGQGIFTYGTDDYGDYSRCNKDGCDCYCIVAVTDGVCDAESAHKGYKIYRLLKDDNTSNGKFEAKTKDLVEQEKADAIHDKEGDNNNNNNAGVVGANGTPLLIVLCVVAVLGELA